MLLGCVTGCALGKTREGHESSKWMIAIMLLLQILLFYSGEMANAKLVASTIGSTLQVLEKLFRQLS